MRYSREISNYLEKIILYDPTPMMSMANLVAILRTYSECSFRKEFNELIRMNPSMIILPNYQ